MLDDERQLLRKGIDVTNRLRNWYNDRLKSLETREKLLVGRTTFPLVSPLNKWG